MRTSIATQLESVATAILERFAASALLAVLLMPLVAGATDPPGRIAHIGFLSQSPETNSNVAGLRRSLAAHGYEEGRNLVFSYRHGNNDKAHFGKAAAELVALKVDVIFAVTSPAAFAAKQVTSTIPIVVWAAHGAVQTGLVSNLRRPGGNVTGTESQAPELDAKRMQLLKQIVPGLQRLGVLYESTDQGSPEHLAQITTAGKSLGIGHAPLPVVTPADIAPVFASYKGPPLGGLLTLTSWMTGAEWPLIRDQAAARRLPTMCEFRFMAQTGCLLSYGPTFDEINERCAAQIDKILRGTPPGELPIEQPTRFELVINLKTAKVLGITVPQELLLRADEVIE
jgi:putative tryptophan/tyrosine transport system substrate-binding protein